MSSSSQVMPVQSHSNSNLSQNENQDQKPSSKEYKQVPGDEKEEAQTLMKQITDKQTIIDNKYIQNLRRKLERNENRLFHLGWISIFLNILDSEIKWGCKHNYKDPSTSFYIVNFLRILTLLIVIISVIILTFKNHYKSQLLVKTHKYPNQLAYFQDNIIQLFLEYSIVCIHVPPFVDQGAKDYFYRQEAVTALHFASFSKLFFAIQYVKNKSPLNSPNGRFIGSITNVEYSALFLVKAWLEVNPLMALVGGFMIIVVASSYLMFIIERETSYETNPLMEQRHKDFLNTVWLLLITVLTVGYGDMYPITDMGRLIAIFAGFGGLLLSAALITLVHKYLTLRNDERSVMDFIERNIKRKQIMNMAAICIQQMFKVNLLRKKGKKYRAAWERFKLYNMLEKWRKMQLHKASVRENNDVQNNTYETLLEKVENIHEKLQTYIQQQQEQEDQDMNNQSSQNNQQQVFQKEVEVQTEEKSYEEKCKELRAKIEQREKEHEQNMQLLAEEIERMEEERQKLTASLYKRLAKHVQVTS